MGNDEIKVEITEGNVDSFIDQMNEENEVYTLDCMALNPHIDEMTKGSRASGGTGCELQIFEMEVDGQDVFAVWREDGDYTDAESFADRISFWRTELAAREALTDEYNDWVRNFD